MNARAAGSPAATRGLGGVDQRGVREQQRLRREDLGLARGQPRRGRGELLARGVQRGGEPLRLLVRRAGGDGVEVERAELRPARRPDRQAAHRGHAAQHGARGRGRRGAAARGAAGAASRALRARRGRARRAAARRRRDAAPAAAGGAASPRAAAPCTGRLRVRRVAEVVGRQRAQRREQLPRLRAARGDLELVAVDGAEHRQPGHAAPVGGPGAARRVAQLDRRVVVGDQLDDPPRRAQVQAEAVADGQALDERFAVRDRCRGRLRGVVLLELRRLHHQRPARLGRDLGQRGAAARPRRRGDRALDERRGGEHHRAAVLLEHLERDLRAHQRAAQIHQHEHAVGGAHAFDRRAHALGVGADRAVVEPARRLDGDLVAAHLARQLGRPFRQLARCARR